LYLPRSPHHCRPITVKGKRYPRDIASIISASLFSHGQFFLKKGRKNSMSGEMPSLRPDLHGKRSGARKTGKDVEINATE